MSTANKKAAGVDNTARRTWDKSEYEDKAKERDDEETKAEESKFDARKRRRQERDPLHQGLIVQRATLKAREHKIDLAANLHKSQIVSVGTPLDQQAGYYCNVCNCVLKDSLSMLDHINGKWHQRALGMSMRVEQSTAEQVKGAIARAKERKRMGKLEAEVASTEGYGMQAIEAAKDESSDNEDGDPGEQGDHEEQEDDDGLDPDMAAMMGFGGFGSTKQQ